MTDGAGKLLATDKDIYFLCDYDSGVNGEGHSGWFYNTENCDGRTELDSAIQSLKNLLPGHLYSNLTKAYDSYETDSEEDICDEADNYFYSHKQEILDILQINLKYEQ